MEKRSYADQFEGLTGDQRETAIRIGNDIRSRVEQIRTKKDEIEKIKLSSGITDCEIEINVLREKLYPLAKEFNEVTGGLNWQDSEGFCQFRSEGESHKYDVDKVDQGLSQLVIVKASLEVVASGKTPRFQVDSAGRMMTADELCDLDGATREDAFEMLSELSQAYRVLQEEVSTRMQGLQVGIETIQTSRSTSKSKSTVAIK